MKYSELASSWMAFDLIWHWKTKLNMSLESNLNCIAAFYKRRKMSIILIDDSFLRRILHVNQQRLG
jgi:hypothetical protein